MKILLTGCSGFIGSVVLKKALERYGADSLVALTSSTLDVPCRVVQYNSYNFNSDVFLGEGLNDIDTIIHIGAFIPKKTEEANDIFRCNSNIFFTEKLLYAPLPTLKKVVYLSTVDVYEDTAIISETSQVNPATMYGWSKLYCEKAIQKTAEQRKIIYQILRIGHVFGPGEEKYKKIIPVTIVKLLRNEPLEIYGDGMAVRTFIYIDDVADAILNAVELPHSEGIINVVGDMPVTIKNLTELLIQIHGNSDVAIEYVTTLIKNRSLVFDNTKLKKTLLNKFTPLEEGLRREYQYMKERGL